MERAYYSDSVRAFLGRESDAILGEMARRSNVDIELTQRDAWKGQIPILKSALEGHDGHLLLEFAVPRMGSRADAVLVLAHCVVVIEFKVGKDTFTSTDIDQVTDYCLDLHNFHEPSHRVPLVPVLLATQARHLEDLPPRLVAGVNSIVRANAQNVKKAITHLVGLEGVPVDHQAWLSGRYLPTPSIIEAATALYANHSVAEITHSEAGRENLSRTSKVVQDLIQRSRSERAKSIIFVTGVPGAGKTLVGLDVATKFARSDGVHAVYQSGNGPLVQVLREALVRDKVARAAQDGRKTKKKAAHEEVKAFIQSVHHYRDEYLRDPGAPADHVAIFDEAQRAWNQEQAASFMKRKRNVSDFAQSEPEFLISVVDRHPDWASIVCLVGNGQEIHTGEAGIRQWLEALSNRFGHWTVYASPELPNLEPGCEYAFAMIPSERLQLLDDLHLKTSIRSFRSGHLSDFVRLLLEGRPEEARALYRLIRPVYPMALTRSLDTGRAWLRQRAMGTERTGLLATSSAERLRAIGLHVKNKIDPVHWFLEPKNDVRSSNFLEEVATEFDIQGLEIDWACVTWDADLRRTGQGWQHMYFRGHEWQRVKQAERQQYLLNSYRVLLTRSRKGMIIVVPEGNCDDKTRQPDYYDRTFTYLAEVGIEVV